MGRAMTATVLQKLERRRAQWRRYSRSEKGQVRRVRYERFIHPGDYWPKARDRKTRYDNSLKGLLRKLTYWKKGLVAGIAVKEARLAELKAELAAHGDFGDFHVGNFLR